MNLLRFLPAVRKTGFAALAALANRRVPGRLKVWALVAIAIVLSPLNILGDIPLLGVVDDAGLLALVLVWFTRSSLPYINTVDAQPVVNRAGVRDRGPQYDGHAHARGSAIATHASPRDRIRS